MSVQKDPFEVVLVQEEADAFAALADRPVGRQDVPVPVPTVPMLSGAATAILHGFDLEERPLLSSVPGLPHEIVPARTTVVLRRNQVGGTAVLVFENADPRRPIVVGVLQDGATQPEAAAPAVPAPVTASADDDRFVVTAEREIVLQCGEASITLTRAGKVLIKGSYILSRSSGYNKIKGAAVDIN
jgi:hypothetical protein